MTQNGVDVLDAAVAQQPSSLLLVGFSKKPGTGTAESQESDAG